MRSLLNTGLATALLFFHAHPAMAADYTIDPAHSQVLFKVKHLGISSVTGRFDNFEGQFSFDPDNLTASKANATIDVSSINTNQGKRDNHLRSCDFFCQEQFPKMEFATKQVKDLGNGKFQIIGDLQLHGIKREVALDGEFLGTAKGPQGEERAAFVATGALNRKDFGLKWDKLTETGGVMVGDEVTITLEIEGVQQSA